ncbi:MAG: phasin family protein [Desulfobacteraceae bacterium]
MLSDTIKKGFLAGLGAVLLTRDKIDRVVENLVSEAKINREEAEKLRDDLIDAGEKQWSDMEKRILDIVKKSVDQIDIARKSEVEELRSRVVNLEKRLAILEQAPGGTRTEGAD